MSKKEHYLISVPLMPHDARSLHCYLITTNSTRDIEGAANKMLTWSEQNGLNLIPMFASTGPLDKKHAKIVRDIVSQMPEVKESLETVENFHITIFMADFDNDAKLMAIH